MIPLFPDAIVAVARSQPETAAVTDERGTLSYRDLDRRSAAVAAGLRCRGIGPGDVVGVLLKRSVEAVVAVIGVLRSGAAFVPLDPAYPDRQLLTMAETAGAVLVLDDGSDRLGLPRCDIAALSGPPVTVPIERDSLAYVIHTSGSTGRPKAVAVSHRALAAQADGWLDSYAVRGRRPSVLQVAGLSFDVFIEDIARGLLSGGRLVICPDETRFDPETLADLIDSAGIELCELTPAVMRLLVDHLTVSGRTLPGLKLLAVGGERWTVRDWRRLAPVVPNARIANTYGPVEATVDSTVFIGPPPPSLDETAAMPIGVPHRATEALVVDQGRVIAAGTGELYLAGDCLAEGYVGDPVRTAERFVTHPLDPGRRALRTGDLVRRDHDGLLHFLGRRDDMVKIRGVQVRRGEIESVLASHAGVRRVVVDIVDTTGDPVVTAHVVTCDGVMVHHDELRALVRGALSDQAVPTRVVEHPYLPVTPNGKVDLRALRATAERAQDSAPVSSEPAAVALACWQEVLGVDTVAAEDDFFAAGGDSLGAARVLLLSGARLGRRLPARLLHEHPTFDAFVAALNAETPQPEAAPNGARPDTHRLTPPQRRLWTLHQLAPEDVSYTVSTVIEIEGELDVAALRQAVDELVRRHEPLRTIIDDSAAEPVARVLEPAPVTIETGTDDAAVAAFLGLPFVLNRDRPFRAMLITRGPGRHTLVLAVHHIATDARTTAVLLDELGRFYDVGQGDAAAAPAEVEVTFGELAERTPTVSRRGAPIDTVAAPLALEPGELGVRSTRLGPELAEAVRAAARDRRTTPFVVLLAAFAELVGRWSDTDDVRVGYPVSTREPGCEEVVGFFVETAVLVVDRGDRPSYAIMLDRAHASVRSAPSPLERIAQAPGPVFRAWFNHLGPPEQPPRLRGLRTTLARPPVTPALFDLNVYVVDEPDDIRIDVVAAADTTDVLEQYRRLLIALLAEPDRPASAHPLPSAALPDPADPLSHPPRPRLSAILARRAGAGVVDHRGRTSHAELRRRAAGVAGDLRRAGMRPGDTVAVEGHRSAGFVATVLGVLAVRGRLLVLDPDHPAAYRDARMRLAGARFAVVPGEASRATGAGRGGVASDAGYVVFTSGTTGAPLAVTAGLGPVAHFLRWFADEHTLGPDDRFAILAGLGHDPLMRDLLLPLAVGGELHIPTSEVRRSPVDLLRWLTDHRITVATVTPPLARAMCAAAGAEGLLPDLRLLCLAGDVVTARDVTMLRALAPGATILNGYGTSETPQLVSAATLHDGGPVTIGAGAPGSQLLVLAADGRLCGVGEAGEIVVRSRHLAERYLDPSAEGFAPDPVDGVRRFHTGDRGRYRPDGTVVFLGRTDDLAKVSGYRVNPREVDAAIADDPRIAASVTVVDGDGDRLVSYVVPADHGADPETVVRQRLRTLLPAHLVPAAVVVVDALPLTPNGKVDRALLPAPRRPDVGLPPTTDLEVRIARIWSTVLGVDPVGVTDNFFDIGGNSLKLGGVHAALRRELGTDVGLLTLYENPSVRSLANRLAGAGETVVQRERTATDTAGERDRRRAARSRLTNRR